MTQPTPLLVALAELTEAMTALAARLGREAEQRLGQEPLAPAHRGILGRLVHSGEAAVGELGDALDLTASAVRAGLAELERRGLAERVPGAARSVHQRYRATELARRLRELSRDRAGYHFGYALASMSTADLTALEQATDAILGLAAAISPPVPRHHGGRGGPA